MTDCTTKPNGKVCTTPGNYAQCRPWDITQHGRLNCYADSIAAETLSISGAQVNIFKLLGVQEQTRLVDLVGNGDPISGGDAPNYPASNAFTNQKSEWRSKQTGSSAIIASSYIGYDLGLKKTPSGREQYGILANVREHITTIRVKQSDVATKRVTSARVERSDNGSQWYGVAVIQLPNNNQLNTINFKQSVPSRYWRLRPLVFTGSECDSWAVSAFEMHDYAITDINNIQDPILLENRDRDYMQPAVLMKGHYELFTTNTELLVFGRGIPQTQYVIKIHFNTCVAVLGRPIVVGDIVELPSEVQYSPSLKPIKMYLEVSDVTWDTTSYTPGWMPTLLSITAVPALATQETRSIFGDLAPHADTSGLFDIDDGNHQKFQDFSAIDQTIKAVANDQVPERGSEGSNTIREFTPAEIEDASQVAPHLNRIGFNRTGLYVEDAMPQNDAPFTRGPDFPTTPKDGDYHRMEYVGLASDVPARLYRYSATKGAFVYLETDRRAEFNNQKATLEEYTTSSSKVSAREIK